jgi:hypothetical protein
MAVSHSFTSEHVEHGGDEKADAERDHDGIKHGSNPRVYPFAGAPDGAEPESGLAGAHQMHP